MCYSIYNTRSKLTYVIAGLPLFLLHLYLSLAPENQL